jgi:polysaccharide export outer membrane protein
VRRWPPPVIRALLLVAGVLAVNLLPALTSRAEGQVSGSDLYSLPKNLKSLQWDWYTKDMRELTFSRLPGASPDYRLGPGDELEVTVIGLDAPVRVSIREAGDVTMPHIGSVKAAGLTAEELEEAIAAAFLDQQLLERPEVLVFISSYEAKKFWVYGQVDRPGEYTMSQTLTVMDAILIAGGLDFYGDRWGYLHRRRGAGGRPGGGQALVKSPDVARPGTEVIKLDLQPMRDGGLLSPNLELQDGDEIVVPTRYPTVFYVIGSVKSPGGFELTSGERLTLSHALAQAGGPTRTAQKKGVVVRYGPDGQRRDLLFDCEGVLMGRHPDIDIQSNDLIFVPNSTDKAIGYGVADSIPGIVTMIPFVR